MCYKIQKEKVRKLQTFFLTNGSNDVLLPVNPIRRGSFRGEAVTALGGDAQKPWPRRGPMWPVPREPRTAWIRPWVRSNSQSGIKALGVVEGCGRLPWVRDFMRSPQEKGGG